MKTTIDIPEPILSQLRKVAGERKTTMKALIESAVREVIAGRNRPRERFRLVTHTFGGKGLRKGLGWDDWGAILDRSYEGRGA